FPSRTSAASSRCCLARTAWCTSASWPTSASRRPRTSSRTATKSGSSASAWTTRAASSCRAKPRWRIARLSSATTRTVTSRPATTPRN
ncbi:uncharacterized protein METZ01_LOCUS266052, partial [marine metagenome]